MRDKIADFAGISGRTLERIQAIIDAAERQPRRFGSLVAEMDSHGRIDATYRKLRRMIDEEQRLAVKPLKGKFRTLCIDPPWAYAIGEETIRPVYATMSQKELLALPISSWADDPAHLYLWTRNADLPDAFQLVEAWGFKYLTMLTWVKPYFGMGSYFRTSTEHVLFGVRGHLLTRVRNIGTHFFAPKASHSEKRDFFYELVERASYPPCVDVFARRKRSGWSVWATAFARSLECRNSSTGELVR